MTRVILPALTFCAFLAVSGTMRADDDFDRIRAAGQVAAQKWAQQVNEAIDLSRKREKSDPFEAKDTLQDMLRRVSNTNELNDGQRAPLVSRLKVRLESVSDLANQKRIKQDLNASEKPKKTPAYDPRAGTGTSAAAKDFLDSAKGATKVHQDMIRQREKGFNQVGSVADNVVIPGESGVAFPKNWAAIVAKRPTGPALSPKEAALLKTLNSVMSVDYDAQKFRAVIDQIQDRTGLSLIIDEASMQDARAEYDDPVTFKANKISVRTILKKILGDKGLTYVIKEGALQVMTPKKASEMVIIRTYPIDDLVQLTPQMMAMYGPFYGNMMQAKKAQGVIDLIQSLIEPSYWAANGGPGTITYLPQTRSLVVRASAEMHYQLASPNIFGR